MSALEEGGEVNDKVGELEKVSGAKASIWKSVANHMHARRMRITELFSIIDKDKNKAVSKNELFEFLKTIGVEADKEELKEAFTFDGKLEKELSLSQLKSEVSRFSRDLADMASQARPKSPARTRSPAKKASGYGQTSSPRAVPSKGGGTGIARVNSGSSVSSIKSNKVKSTPAIDTKVKEKLPKTKSQDKSPAKGRPIKVAATSAKASKPSPKASPNAMDALSALADASNNDEDASETPRRRPSDSEMGINLVGMDDWSEVGSSKKVKKDGVVICFDELGKEAALMLHEDLTDLKVNMKPLFEKGDDMNEYKTLLESVVLLVILRTSSYGKEPKNAVEVKQIKAGSNSALILDLCGEDEVSHLSTLLKNVKEDECNISTYRTLGGWDPKQDEIPEGMSAHVVNYMIAEQSKSASYNDDPSSKFAATSNAKPKRLSLIDFDTLGDEEENKAASSPKSPDIAADEETFQRFQKEEAEDEEEMEQGMDNAFQRFQMEQGDE